MGIKYFKALLPVLSIATLAHADQPGNEVEKPAAPKKDQQLIQYHNRVILFAPFHQGYERIKPDAFYVGVEAYIAPVLNKSDDNMLVDAELRMGYNLFYNGRDHLTPFAAFGFVKDFYGTRHHEHHKPGILYGAAGFLYDHEFTRNYSLGFNAKLMVGGPVSEKHYDWGSPVVGTDLALPFTIRFGYKRHWDYRIEPFFMYLHGSDNAQDYFGFRSNLGYRF